MEKRKVELLAPAGDMASFASAINNGADAIYLGYKFYGARAYANNFKIDEIESLIRIAHLLNVKVYVTVNTLIKESEIDDCLSLIKKLYQANVDGVLMQDLGLITLAHAMFPSLVIHASTQLNVISMENALELEKLGVSRIVIAREANLDFVREIKEKTKLEVEVFVHGALCNSYSGNCYFSSIIGKRSGNRGRCGATCRLKYNLLKDNIKQGNNYYLSMKDLCTIDYLNEIIESGVDSLKIEGRGKPADYVGLVTKAYRDKLDALNIDYKTSLELSFNREFTKGYILGEDKKNITNPLSVNHIGKSIGKVINAYKKNDLYYAFVLLDSITNFKININDSFRIMSHEIDAVTIQRLMIFDKNANMIKEVNMVKNGDILVLPCHKLVDLNSTVLKTKDNELVNTYNSNGIISKKTLVDIVINEIDDQLEITFKTINLDKNKEITIRSDKLEKAKSDQTERIKEQLSKLNDTFFKVNNIICDHISLFIVIKDINELRREIVRKLEDAILKRDSLTYGKYQAQKSGKEVVPEIICVVRNDEQLKVLEKYDNITILSDELDIDQIDKRIGEKNTNYGSAYNNVMNAYSLNYYLRNKKNVCLSFENSFDDLDDIMYDYQELYQESPNVSVLVYGRIELMIMKHCIIQKYENTKEQCMMCKNHQYALEDEYNHIYPIIRKYDCNNVILNCNTLNLINKIKDIKDLGIKSIMLIFTIESEMEVKNVIDNFILAYNGEKYHKDLGLPYMTYTYGHFKEGIE